MYPVPPVTSTRIDVTVDHIAEVLHGRVTDLPVEIRTKAGDEFPIETTATYVSWRGKRAMKARSAAPVLIEYLRPAQAVGKTPATAFNCDAPYYFQK